MVSYLRGSVLRCLPCRSIPVYHECPFLVSPFPSSFSLLSPVFCISLLPYTYWQFSALSTHPHEGASGRYRFCAENFAKGTKMRVLGHQRISEKWKRRACLRMITSLFCFLLQAILLGRNRSKPNACHSQFNEIVDFFFVHHYSVISDLPNIRINIANLAITLYFIYLYTCILHLSIYNISSMSSSRWPN